MAGVKSSLVLCFLAVWAVDFSANAAPPSHQAPAPAVDCSSLILNMADCLSYVSNDSTTTKPEGTCCSGLKTVLKADADCLCQAFRSSAQLGVVLNVTKALSLPAACKVSAPAAANCGLSITPAAAPGLSPESSPTSGSAYAPAAGPTSVNESSPAPAPRSSGSSLPLTWVGSLFAVGSGIALFSL